MLRHKWHIITWIISSFLGILTWSSVVIHESDLIISIVSTNGKTANWSPKQCQLTSITLTFSCIDHHTSESRRRKAHHLHIIDAIIKQCPVEHQSAVCKCQMGSYFVIPRELRTISHGFYTRQFYFWHHCGNHHLYLICHHRHILVEISECRLFHSVHHLLLHSSLKEVGEHLYVVSPTPHSACYRHIDVVICIEIIFQCHLR